MKKRGRLRWIILFTLLGVLSMLILSRVNAVGATISDIHMAKVLFRVESELMQKTPAGQYYESLMWKHTAEINQIMSAYPENNEKTFHALRLFTPALEALVDGKGDTTRITSEQVDILNQQLDFYASVGGPAFRADIEKERQRLQLNLFVGMTMNEAWDHINAVWTPDSTETPQLVSGSDGKWAYYVHDGVYLEYPANFRVQVSEMKNDKVYFIPSSGSPESWNPCTISVTFTKVSPEEKERYNPRIRFSSELVPWEGGIESLEFPGLKFVLRAADWPGMSFHAYQYNEANQIAVEVWVAVFENPQLADPTAYAELIDQRYEYFPHMVDSLRIQPK